jgi:hypothetical protein
MTVQLYSILNEVETFLQTSAQNEFLAKSSVFIASTLYSVNYSDYGDVDLHYEPKVVLRDKSKNKLIRLAIMSWYVPEELGYYLRLAIDPIIRYNSDFIEVDFICQSKMKCRIWLSEYCSKHNGNQIFGNFLDKNNWSEKFFESLIKLKRLRNHKRINDRKPEKRYIGVGYKDKGTLPKESSVKNSEMMLTSLQNQIEENRDISDSLKLIFEGFLL